MLVRARRIHLPVVVVTRPVALVVNRIKNNNKRYLFTLNFINSTFYLSKERELQ